MNKYLLIFLLIFPLNMFAQNANFLKKPVRIGVVGLVHTHVHWILGREKKGDIEIVGIAEPNRNLAERYTKQHGLSMNIVYTSIDEMLSKTQPDAVTAFNTIFGHLEVVEKCAPLGIHVMVEKPLAVSLDHARKMEALAKKHKILLLTNYETSWYGSNHEILKLAVKDKKLGDLRKIVVHDGHQGPIEIGCNPEFTDWLCDPKWNGGGAIIDFGCYGANLTTWLLKGQRPLSVQAVTQQIKPHLYPKVDDEATILITYPKTQAILQASWNWPFSRKDIEVYGSTGFAFADNGQDMRVRLEGEEHPRALKANSLSKPWDDPFSLLAALVNQEITLEPYDLSSLENNMIVVEILEAAVKSAKTSKVVVFKEKN
ncbi:MAG: Gfo/Idh/MocA family oxidoreductase [Microscillaceae bacterium]|nr:Gfo/Idh/MocA family oxidoreductase [Microscillaceae bacterium]